MSRRTIVDVDKAGPPCRRPSVAGTLETATAKLCELHRAFVMRRAVRTSETGKRELG